MQAEFLDTMDRFARGGGGPDEKVLFLFRMYDLDGDGVLTEAEVEAVIRASLHQSGLRLPDGDVLALTAALCDEAAEGREDGGGEISIDQVRESELFCADYN